MKYKFILFSPWLLKINRAYDYGSKAHADVRVPLRVPCRLPELTQELYKQ